MRKGLIEVIILVFGLLGYIATPMAQVNHVSINSRQFELNNVPQLKMNIVAQNDDASRLRFYIRQLDDGQFQQQTLSVQSINRFLLQLNGTDVINDNNAQLIISEATPSGVVTLAVVAVFDAPYSFKSATLTTYINKQRSAAVAETPVKDSSVIHPVKKKTPQPSPTVALPRTSADSSSQQANCLIERDNRDTLWRIANRYKEQWHTSVYGAMLAIFEANLVAFSKQKIHLLLKDVPLNCPSAVILAEYNNKAIDKKVFEVIEAKHAAK
ncbi:FimV/HubP family polar landmark protein [Shewanella frigidimarina]|uniref:FimV/HubP family polar landmark protein n=1 Tax=Shewanella frigidimarina TaxID=56812 RepID=UPI003D7A17C6